MSLVTGSFGADAKQLGASVTWGAQASLPSG